MKNLEPTKRDLLLNRLRGMAAPVASARSRTQISKTDRMHLLPLSWSQQRLWFIDQLQGAGQAYHIAAAVRLHGVLKVSALQAALDTMLERHEALRTVFASVEGSAIQVIQPPSQFSLQQIDLSDLEAQEREAQITEQATQEAQAPFDLSTGPLIRARLLRVSSDEHVMLMTMHHIVSDGWSMGIFIREVAQLYAAYCEGRSNPLPPLPIQYADYALWQREWLSGVVLEQQLSYWKQQLAGAPALLELPTDRPRPTVQSYRGESLGFALDVALSERLNRFSREHDLTLFMSLYAGFAILLSRLS